MFHLKKKWESTEYKNYVIVKIYVGVLVKRIRWMAVGLTGDQLKAFRLEIYIVWIKFFPLEQFGGKERGKNQVVYVGFICLAKRMVE